MTKGIESLPAPIARRLDELKASLVATLGDDLVAMLVFGSVARGGYRAERSDVDVMLVLRSDREEKLEAIGPALQLARYSARIETILLTSAEVAGAADVFPLLYEDVGRCHVCLHGKSPFDRIESTDEHRRLRIEQELREARIRMRRLATDLAPTPAFAAALDHKLKQVRSPLRALLRMRAIDVSDELDDVLAKAAARYEIDAAPLRRLHEDARSAFTTLAALLDAAIADVDAGAGEARPEPAGDAR